MKRARVPGGSQEFVYRAMHYRRLRRLNNQATRTGQMPFRLRVTRR